MSDCDNLLRKVYEDMLTATETWVDSDAGPATLPGQPRELREISPEVWAELCAYFQRKREGT